MGSAANAGGCSAPAPMHQRKPQQEKQADQIELIANVTHAAPLSMHNLLVPQARVVLVDAICGNLRFFFPVKFQTETQY